MTPRDLPNLVIGNAPAMDVDLPRRSSRRRAGWLAACSLVVLVGAGITATLVSSSAADPPPKRPKITRPVEPALTPPRARPHHQPATFSKRSDSDPADGLPDW